MTFDISLQTFDIPAGVTPSPRVLAVAQMFGLGLEPHHRRTILPPLTLPIDSGAVIFVTGVSGGGKSTLLRLLHDQLTREPAEGERESIAPAVWRFDAMPPPADEPLVDLFADAPLDRAWRRLSLAGLNDAWVMLRRPRELSDGQRVRLDLARLMQQVEARTHQSPGDRWTQSLDVDEVGEADADIADAHPPRAVVLADEFAATLDRQTAAVVARNVRKWVTRSGACFIAATTHDDLLEPLAPDVLVETQAPGEIEVHAR